MTAFLHDLLRIVAVPVLGKLSTVLPVALIGATFLANLGQIASLLGTPAIPAAALLTVGAVAAGYALGVPSTDARVVLGLGTGQRNIAAATVVATSGFATDEPLEMVVVTSLVAFAVLFPAAWLLRRRLARRARARLVQFDGPQGGGRGAGGGRSPRRPAVRCPASERVLQTPGRGTTFGHGPTT